MDLHKIIRELKDERNRLEQIVSSLEQLQITKRPAGTTLSRRGRKSMDSAARSEVSKRMKRYWAARRAQASSS